MTAQHSPGPWKVIGNPPTEILSMSDTEEGEVIADTQLMHGEPTPRQLADARLIAAAPDLLAEIKSVRFTLEDAQDAWSGCECEDCRECGLEVSECSGTECARTCQCSTCRYCLIESALDGIDAVVARAEGRAS